MFNLSSLSSLFVFVMALVGCFTTVKAAVKAVVLVAPVVARVVVATATDLVALACATKDVVTTSFCSDSYDDCDCDIDEDDDCIYSYQSYLDDLEMIRQEQELECELKKEIRDLAFELSQRGVDFTPVDTRNMFNSELENVKLSMLAELARFSSEYDAEYNSVVSAKEQELRELQAICDKHNATEPTFWFVTPHGSILTR